MYLFITLKMKIAFILYSIMVISWCECKRTPNTLIERKDMIANIAPGLGRSKIEFIKLTSQNYGKNIRSLSKHGLSTAVVNLSSIAEHSEGRKRLGNGKGYIHFYREIMFIVDMPSFDEDTYKKIMERTPFKAYRIMFILSKASYQDLLSYLGETHQSIHGGASIGIFVLTKENGLRRLIKLCNTDWVADMELNLKAIEHFDLQGHYMETYIMPWDPWIKVCILI